MGNILCEKDIQVWYLARAYFCKVIALQQEDQAFRFMVGPRHFPMISKYGPSLSKAVGPVDPSFLAVKNLTLIKNIHLTASPRTSQNRKYL